MILFSWPSNLKIRGSTYNGKEKDHSLANVDNTKEKIFKSKRYWLDLVGLGIHKRKKIKIKTQK